MSKIAIRFDDITEDMDWNKFRRMESLLERYQVKPLLGLVPENHDPNLQKGGAHPDFSSQLQVWQKRGYSFAVHGMNHIYTTKAAGLFPLNAFSEFAGVSYEKQKEMLQRGKSLLEAKGIVTDIFMAPGHSFDKNTLKALKEVGFRYVTDGFGTVPYMRSGLIFLPIAFRKGKDVARKDGYTTVVFHTNSMTETDFVAAEKMFEAHASDFTSYTEYLQVVPVGRSIFGNWKEYGMATVKRLLVKGTSMLH